MTPEEAEAWLRGERSTINYAGGDSPQDAQERATRMDAAMTEQAYWVMRAQGVKNGPRVLEGILVGLLIAVVFMAIVVYFQL